MLTTHEKVRENYYRRRAKRLGLVLRKSKAKRWSLTNQQGYMIVDEHRNLVIYGDRYDLNLDEVQEFLDRHEKAIRV
jgi:hypothetical protein